MIIHGGTNPQRWTIATTDHTSSTGRVLKRIVTITIEGPDGTQLVMTARQAHSLASALHHAAKNGDPH